MSHTPRLLCIAVLLLHSAACHASEAAGFAASPCYPDDCMNETVTLEAAGLFTNPNPVGGQVPAGAMLRAGNVVSDAPGRVTPRRGMRAFDYALAASTPPTGKSAFFYGDTLMVHTSANSLVRDTGSAFTPVLNAAGSAAAVLPPLMGGRVHATAASSKLYVNTQTGVQELDGVTGVLKSAGAPRALDIRTHQLTTPNGFLPSGGVTGYRVLWGYNDSRGVPVLGEPSGRMVVKNETRQALLSRTGTSTSVELATDFPFIVAPGETITVSPTDANNPAPDAKVVTARVVTSAVKLEYTEAGPAVSGVGPYTIGAGGRNTRLFVQLPSGVRAGDFLQVYRTASVISPLDDPGDNMAQVAEIVVTSAHVAAGVIIHDDVVPDALRQGPLYTNALQQGAGQANAAPPLARDIAAFRTSVFLANTSGPHRLTFRFLGLPSENDTLTIGGLVYTAGSESTSGGFRVEPVDADTTVSQAIATTTRSLINSINRDTRGTILNAYYVSSDADAPGVILLQAKVAGTAPFTIQASANGTRYAPELVSAVASARDVRPNRLHFSKAELPYAFPLGNTIPVGSEDSEILRIVALRDSLYIFKKGTGEGRGLWRLNGSGPGAFYVTQVNASLDLIASESLAVVDNQILGLSSSGIFAVSESGVEFISPPIENLVRDIIVGASGALESVAHGVGYESTTERKYFLWVPDSSDDTLPAFAFVYNLNTETWTTRDDSPSCAAVGGSGKKLHTCMGTTMHAERRTGTAQDYMGPRSVTATATASTANGVITNSPGSFSVDMAVWTTGSGEAGARRVVAVNNTTGELTLSGPLTGGTFPQSLFGAHGIAVDVAWTMNSAGAPTAQKQFFDAALLFSEKSTATWGFHFQIDGMEPGEWESTLGYAEGTPYCRAEVPWSVQRTTRIITRATRSVAVEKVDILGMRSSFNIYRGTLDL